MGYSRAVRRQLIALDLIEGIIDAEKDANPDNVEIGQVLWELSDLSQRIKGEIVLLNRDGGPVFESKKEYERYKREVQAAQRAVIDAWPGEELDGREYVNAILLATFDKFAKVSSKTQHLWAHMLGALQKLYENMDPGLTAEDSMDAGERAAQTLVSALEDI